MSSSAICRRSCSQDVTELKVARLVMSKTSRAPEAPLKYDRVIDLYVSWPAVSHNDSFMCFCCASFLLVSLGDLDFGAELGLLMLYSKLAGGPTGTMRLPNSTPIVTSWWETNRPGVAGYS